MSVGNPTDDLMRISRVEVLDVEDAREVILPTVSGTVFMAPSAYVYKMENLFAFPIDEMNPVWLYTAADYNRAELDGEVIFRQTKDVVGVRLPMTFLNKKYESLSPTMSGEGMNLGSMVIDNIPINYIGSRTAPDELPSITQHMVPDDIRINQESLTEYEIVVLNDLDEDTFFMTPVTNPKHGSLTSFGEFGTESEMPEGAVVGLVKVKTEAKITRSGGCYLVTGAERSALEAPSMTLHSDTTTIGGQLPEPWFTNPFPTLRSYPQWQTIHTMVQEQREIYSAAYETSTTSVGVGIFVRDVNQPAVLPWSSAASGIMTKHRFVQNPNDIKRTVKVRELLDCTEFIARFRDSLRFEVRSAPVGACIPITAADVQIAQTWPENGIGPLTDLNMLYPYPVEGAFFVNVQTTPLALPMMAAYHCYTPMQVYRCGRRVSMLHTQSPNADINLIVTMPPIDEWQETTNSAGQGSMIPRNITSSPGLHDGDLLNPIGDFSKDWWGFNFYRDTRTWDDGYRVTWSNRNGSGSYWVSVWRTTSTLRGWWWNPQSDLTFGEETTSGNPTAIPIMCNMTLVLTGLLPAGTPAGTYKFKPFRRYVQTRGALNAVNPQFESTDIVGYPVSNSTMVPYIGLNIITAIIGKYNWYRSVRNHMPYSPSHPISRVWNVVESYGPAMGVVPTQLNIFTRLLVDDPRVPLVGYAKRAVSPTMVTVPENGQALCYVDDLAVTAPFWSIYDEAWVIAVASAELNTIYILEVIMSADESIVEKVARTIRTIPLWSCPYGTIQEVLGLAQFTEIRYEDGVKTNTLALYVRLNPEDAKWQPSATLSPLTIILLRDDFNFNLTRDSVAQLPLLPNVPFNQRQHIWKPDVNWPRGIAVMFPYIYVLGFRYHAQPTNTVRDPLIPPNNVANMTGAGWMMAMYRMDVIEGSVPEVIHMASNGNFRFYWGLPARQMDYDTLYWQDRNAVGEYAKYMYGQHENGNQATWPLPVSAALPMKARGELPTLTSLASISAQLIANHMGYTGPVLINPMTSSVETWGLEQFPFAAIYNHNVGVAREYLFASYPFQGQAVHSAHPFMHICIGDGLPPTPFSSSIDIQNASYGRTLIRLAFVRNNLLRDVVSRVRLFVPPPDVLEHSQMLWLGLDKDGPWFKQIELSAYIRPGEQAKFYIKVEPEYEVVDAVNLYINAKFLRVTSFFAYRV